MTVSARNSSGHVGHKVGRVVVPRDRIADRVAELAKSDSRMVAGMTQASEELARRRLEKIEDLYRNAPVGLCELDRALRFVRINERLAEMNGLAAEQHLGG